MTYEIRFSRTTGSRNKFVEPKEKYSEPHAPRLYR